METENIIIVVVSLLIMIILIIGIKKSIEIYNKNPEEARKRVCNRYCNSPNHLLAIITLIQTISAIIIFLALLGIVTILPTTKISILLVAVGFILAEVTLVYTTCPYYCSKQSTQQPCPNNILEKPDIILQEATSNSKNILDKPSRDID